jgi:hypothetical protein
MGEIRPDQPLADDTATDDTQGHFVHRGPK